jgi:hypothetical protein
VLVDFQVLVSCGGCFEIIDIIRVVGVFYWCSCSQFFYKRMWLRDTLGPALPLVPCFGFSSLFENGFSLPLVCGFLWTLCLYVKIVGIRG